jgi:hypothetical protein
MLWNSTQRSPSCKFDLKAGLGTVALMLTPILLSRNSTTSMLGTAPATYLTSFEEVSKFRGDLNLPERLWAAWYIYMQNDVLATGILSFVMHELVYFGRSLPWIIIDTFGLFKKYKIQAVSSSNCTIDSVPILRNGDRTKFQLFESNGVVPN